MKQESVDAMVNVRETLKRNEILEKKVVEQRQVIESQKLKLSEATNANRRLTIHCDSLQDEVQYLSAKVSAMEEIIKEFQTEKSDMVKELHDNRVSTDKERLERERIQIKLDNLKHEALADKLTAEESIKSMCKKVILDLQEEVKKLTAELVNERKRHKVTEKGLRHLRQHFSSLSVQDIIPTNSVEKNQVDRVQYWLETVLFVCLFHLMQCCYTVQCIYNIPCYNTDLDITQSCFGSQIFFTIDFY